MTECARCGTSIEETSNFVVIYDETYCKNCMNW